jgi:eukaryotic-like serine/threonine-protein kinase
VTQPASSLEKLSAALADRYAIEHEIGAGGMATVYLAQDIRHRRKVAIKVLHPELTAVLGPERFLNEIELTANLQHPHILPLFDSGTADTLLFYVMPYVQGETLRTRLSREHQLPVAEALRIAGDVADALEYAHKHGVVHRDIKPENVLLHDGRPLVADFGIALAVQQAGGERMTQTGMSLGTPQYMAPEQAMGDKSVDHRADIYALGAVTYEMLTGEPPFTGPNAQAVVAKILTTDPSSLVSKRRSVPPHVEAAVLTALEKMPADRFASAAQFGDALAGRGPVLETRATTSARAAAAKPDARRRALQALPWAVAAVAVAVGAAGWLRSSSEASVRRDRIMLWRSATPVAIVGRGFAISPDGRTFAFVDTVGKQQLWLKERDKLDPVPITGTDGAATAAFSPDGEWIAFGADGKLKKVPAYGGSAITLSDSAAGAPSVAWLDDGTILFTTGEGHLLSVSAAGGATRRVASADSMGRGVQNVTGLPDGRGAIVTICSPGCDDADIRALDIETGESQVLATEALQGWFLDGHIVFVRRDGGVFRAPFNSRKRVLSGPAVPVLNGVRTGAVTADIMLSRNGTLVYIPGASQAGVPVEVMWVTRSGERLPVDTTWSFVTSVNWGMALSPDGRRLAVGARGVGSDDIWVKEFDGGALRRLTFEGTNTRAAAWTLDGKSVIYTSRQGGGNSDLRVRRADGTGGEEILADLGRGLFEMALTRDSAQFIVRVGAPPSRDILLLRRGGTPTPLVVSERFQEIGPMLSRDGRWLAYASNETGRFEVYVRPFPDVNGGKWQVSRSGGVEPFWARNGRELFYRDGSGNLVAASLIPDASFRTGEHRVLFSTRGLRLIANGRSYDVMPDDQRFIFTRRVGAEDSDRPVPVVVVENWGAELKKMGPEQR